MPTLPRVLYSFLVRTDFTSGGAWRQLSDEAQRENPDGFRANVEPVSDPEFDGVTWETVKAAVPANSVAVIFIADSTALTSPDNPILAQRQRRALPWEGRPAHAGPHLAGYADQASSFGAFTGCAEPSFSASIVPLTATASRSPPASLRDQLR
jgi:hypothetical protein